MFWTIACGLPPEFALKTLDGRFWCLKNSNRYTGDTQCDTERRHIHAWDTNHNLNFGNPIIPPQKCLLEPERGKGSGRYLFIERADNDKNIEWSGNGWSPGSTDSEFHFQAYDAGNGQVYIKSFWDGTTDGVWMDRDLSNQAIRAKGGRTLAECGDDCKFTIDLPPFSSSSSGCMIRFTCKLPFDICINFIIKFLP